MVLRKLIPRALSALLALGICTSAIAQTRPRVAQSDNDVTCSPDDPALINTEAVESKPVTEAKPAKPTIDIAPQIGSTLPSVFRLEPMLLAAIDERLGSIPFSRRRDRPPAPTRRASRLLQTGYRREADRAPAVHQ